jgi:GNAT superfamily N-acetyltransferase
VDKSSRGQGIGTELVKGLIKEAASAGRAVTLAVVKTNPKNDCWAKLELEDDAGVYYEEAQDKWCARIGRDRGWFDTAEEAYAAYHPSSAQRSMQEELSKLGLI